MEILVGAAVTIGLAIVTAMGALAFKDPEAYKRLFKLVKGPVANISNFAAGVFSGAVLVGLAKLDARDVMVVSGAIGIACFAFALVFIFFVWLRADFARYADKD